MIFAGVVQIAIVAGDWVLHVVLPLTSCDFCSQILSVYERSIEVFFFFFRLILLRIELKSALEMFDSYRDLFLNTIIVLVLVCSTEIILLVNSLHYSRGF